MSNTYNKILNKIIFIRKILKKEKNLSETLSYALLYVFNDYNFSIFFHIKIFFKRALACEMFLFNDNYQT